MAKRMFVAIEVPARIRGSLAAIDPGLGGLRWLPAEQLHLTLCFAPSVTEDNGRKWMERLSAIDFDAFQLDLKGLGGFGSRLRPRVVWVGIPDPPDQLLVLQSLVNQAAMAAEIDTSRKFHPHVTVGRCKEPTPRELKEFLARHGNTPFGAFEVREFTLFSSRLNPAGAQHTQLFRVECRS